MRFRVIPARLFMVLCLSAWALGPAANGQTASIPWDLETLRETPKMFPAPGFQEKDVTAVFYEGVPYQGKPTRVFAWYGIPKLEAGKRCPAMILVHGGGGTAFAEWVRLWVGRGYAAIAMDTCGCVPKGKYGDWQRHEMGGPAGWGAFDKIDDPVTDQWTYHAVADIILAHSLIRSFSEVDPDRTGLTGISWGGYLTCVTAGVDPRFKLAVPVYGCGFLGENSTWLGDFEKMGTEKAAKWLGLWDPSVYLPRAEMPMLWITGPNDFAYPPDSWQKSYRLPKGPRTLSLRVGMLHGHGGAGENPEEIHLFVESILNQKEPPARVTGQGQDGRDVWVSFESKTPIAKAELTYTKDTGKWQERKWEIIPAQLDAEKGRATAILPEGAIVYYINLIDNRGLYISSEHVDLSEK